MKTNIFYSISKFMAAGALMFMLPVQEAASRDFHETFADSTLQINYIVGTHNSKPSALLSSVSNHNGWAGRRTNLSQLPLMGNGQLTLQDATTGDTLYRASFSSLFNEWIAIENADSIPQSFEIAVPVPRPRKGARATLTLFDRHHQPFIELSHYIDPTDILIHNHSALPYRTVKLHEGTYDGPKVSVAILPEGFTSEEMPKFMEYAQTTVEALLAHEPFKSLQDRLDLIAVQVPSRDSGVSVPLENQWRETAYESHFSTFGSDRYLTSPRPSKIMQHTLQAGAQHAIVLANTDTYGGGGIYNSYTLTTTGNPKFRPVVVHEFGHSFGGLADEYFYEDEDIMEDAHPLNIEPWEKNITTLVNFDSKWKHLLAPNTPVPTPLGSGIEPGVYEGAGYVSHGIYRGAENCRMRTNTAPDFCPVCVDAIKSLILFLTQK